MSLRETMFYSIAFTVINKYGKGAGLEISIVFGTNCHVACWRIFWNLTFETFVWPPLSQFVLSGMLKLWGSSFFKKRSKYNVDLKNAQNSSEKDLSFLDNCIWIGCVKLSLLRTEYFSSAVNVLTRSPAYHLERLLLNELPSKWSINMIKVLVFRFQQYLGPTTKFLVERSSKSGLFRHLSNNVVRSF